MVRVAIVGAGIGGLCTGLGLVLEGYDVHIYEKNDVPGGVLRSITSPDGDFRFEESASIPIHPSAYVKYFEALGYNSKAYFESLPLQTLYHVYGAGQPFFKVPSNKNKMKKMIQKYFPNDVVGWEKWLKATDKKYKIAKRYFLNKPFLKMASIVNMETLGALIQLNPFSSASRYVKGFVKSRMLRDFILFQAFFMGVDPHQLSNVYTTICSSAQLGGICHIKGGLSQYAKTIANIFQERGGIIHYHSPVEKIIAKDHIVTGLKIGHKTIHADIFVVNADYCYAQKALLHRKSHRYRKRSCSTMILHLGLKKKYPMLNVHNLYIQQDFEKEIASIFKGKLPEHPSLYIYSPSCLENGFCKNPDHSVINIMVRVPNLHDLPIKWNEDTKEKMYTRVMKTLMTIKGLEDIEDHIVYREFTTPVDFKNRYHYRDGSCFGIGHTLLQSVMFRPQPQDKKYHNLYYVGSSVHPGNGVSIVMGGSEMVKKCIKRNHPISLL